MQNRQKDNPFADLIPARSPSAGSLGAVPDNPFADLVPVGPAQGDGGYQEGGLRVVPRAGGAVPFNDLVPNNPRREDMPALPPAAGAVPPVASSEWSVGGILSDVGKGIVEAPKAVVGGISDAVHEIFSFADSAGDWLNENVADLRVPVPKTGIAPLDALIENPAEAIAGPEERVAAPESNTGNLVRNITQFVAPFARVAKAFKVGQASSLLGNTSRAALAGATVDATAFDPHEKRLSDLINEFPALKNPVTEYLAADPNDTEAEGRLKNVVEGLAAGALTDLAVRGFVQSLRILRGARADKARAGAAGVADAVDVPPSAAPDVPAGRLSQELAGPPRVQAEPGTLAARLQSDIDAAQSRVSALQAGQQNTQGRIDNLRSQIEEIAPSPENVSATSIRAADDPVRKYLAGRTDAQLLEAVKTPDPELRAAVEAEMAGRGMDVPVQEALGSPLTGGKSSSVPGGGPAPYPSSEVMTAKGARVRWAQPMDLATWLRSRGGLQDQGGELAAMGVTNAPRSAEFAARENFLGSLVSQNGMTLDDAARAAWEAGYFPELRDRPDVQTFLDALRQTHEADSLDLRRFTQSDADWIASRAPAVPDIDEQARALGIDTQGLSDTQAADEVGRVVSQVEDAAPVSQADFESGIGLAGDPIDRAGQQVLDTINSKPGPRVAGEKAGNIRIDSLNTTQDISAAVKQIADQNAAFGGARRGVVSDSAVQALADDLGMTADRLNTRKLGQAFNAEELLAARQLLADSGENLVTLARAARGGTDEALNAFYRAYTRHVAIQEQVSGATAEAGRALRSMQLRASSERARLQAIKDSIAVHGGRDNIEDLAEKISGLNDPAAVNAFTRQAYKSSLGDKINEYWINALLSGPTTHMVNSVSNALTWLWTVPEDTLTAGLGALRGGSDRMFMREPVARVFGLVEGVRDGFKAFGRAAITGEGFDDTLTKFSDNYKPAIPGPLGSVIRTPTRLLNAEDSFFKTVTYRTELHALSVRKAAQEGLRGQDFARRVGELRASPSEEMVEAAIERARELTFTNQLGKAGAAISYFRNNVPGARWVIPFLKTPINILKFAARRSPAGLVMKEVREELLAGGLSRDKVLAQMSLGTAAAIATASYAREGLITGGGPSDWREKQALMATGWRPYSIKIGGKWYSYNRLDPLGMLMGMSADLATVLDKADETGAGEAAAALSGAFAKTLLDKSYLRGISDLTNALGDPDRYAKRYLENLAASFVPNALGQYARATDPVIRETGSLIDNLRSRIPGQSESLFPKRNVWGEPIRRDAGAFGDGVAGRLLSPSQAGPSERDYTTTELLRLDLVPSKPKKALRNVDLTPAQYDELVQMSGRMTKRALDKLTGSPAYQRMTDPARRLLMEKVLAFGRNAASKVLLARYPEIEQKSAAEKSRAMVEGRKTERIELPSSGPLGLGLFGAGQ